MEYLRNTISLQFSPRSSAHTFDLQIDDDLGKYNIIGLEKHYFFIQIDHKRGIVSYHFSHTNEKKLTLVTGRRAGELHIGIV